MSKLGRSSFYSIVMALGFVASSALAAPKLEAAKSETAKVETSRVETAKTETAIFAGGCFWCMEPPYDALVKEGVISTTVGYSGGRTENPTYEQTSSGDTGHREVIEVVFDPSKISYKKLLEVFWKNVDPLDRHGQFCDKGEQYSSAVYYTNEEQKKAYEQSLAKVKADLKVKGEIATVLLPAKKFYAAEDYHQDYYKKNPIRYKFYRNGCGRDAKLKQVWGSAP